MARERVVVVGGGLTAARAVESMREHDVDDEIVVVTEERRLPYERPPLSKGYLEGDDPSSAIYPLDAAWYRDHDVDVRRGVRATALDVGTRTLATDAGELAWDRLLIATGATARRFEGPGAGLRGVHLLRSLPDATRLRTALRAGDRRVVVIGSSWIGLEVAAAARGYGDPVTVLGRSEAPLVGAVGRELGGMFADLHREHDVEMRTEVAVSAIEGEQGRVRGVVLSTGEEVPADLVVVGIGATPNVGLAASARLTVDDGIVTDAAFRTSADGVYAAGDVANVFNPTLGHRLRVEHWANADASGRAVGRVLAGEELEYDEIPYFYTDQYDLGMEYSGYGELADRADLVVRGDLAARECVAFWLLDRRVVAGMNVNVWDVNDEVQRLIRARVAVDPAALADPDVPLSEIGAAA
ncbi:pyridine nucleotide-disulfide oxidoreductase [Agromyces luteolus]|uniref:NAD(P)/FAD-dependent oxidoreductase n=1 Tax=Agromyces luteolus TaxID=88373 RepID=A0A7C9LEL8_9MICO|nr:FAD-dependent oxidoreductase [Agromyces luteolus]MUN07190.1 NAD(P)/FAD-dependent oxidoreductase [Agromyces luteolus]GLK29646.1 pyridine nucleotide-disulfide oxidoreductase [Agromyces luteolus]